MMRQGFGLLLLSSAWLQLIPLFAPERNWTGALALALLGAALLIGSRKSPRRAALWLVPTVLAWQFLLVRSVYALAANHHQLPWLTPALALLGRLLGLPLHADHGVLFLQTEEEIFPFTTNWEKLGLLLPLTLAVGLTVLHSRGDSSAGRTLRRWTGALLLLGAYTALRYLLLCGLLLEFGDAKGFDDSERLQWFTGFWPTLLSYLPFAWLAGRLHLAGAERGNGALLGEAPAPGPKSQRRLVVVVAAAVGLALFAMHLERPGRPNSGRILVDDFHSGFWEPALPALGTNTFGAQFLYNCSSLVEWLRHFHHVAVNTDGPITEELLRDVDILVLKTPTKRYASTEIAAIHAFVRRGGGLMLIGDHTNLLGMSSFFNELASEFGIEFQYDGSNAYSSGYFSSFRPPWLFAHPIVDGVPPMQFLTSCTLRHGADVTPVILATDVMSDPIDYSKPSFFGRLVPNSHNGFGVFPIAVATHYGQGRVVAFAESTTTSNFATFQDGTAPFYLRAMTFLNQTHAGNDLAQIAALVAAALLGAWTLWKLRRDRMSSILCATGIGALIGYVGAGTALKAAHARFFPSPAPRQALVETTFVTSPALGYHILPAIGPSLLPEDHSFDSLFVVPQRLGSFPRFRRAADLVAARPESRAAILINPSGTFTGAEMDAFTRYVSGGGQLLVIEEPGDPGAFERSLRQRFPSAPTLFERHLVLPPFLTNAVALTNLAPTNAGVVVPALSAPQTATLQAAIARATAPRPLTWSAWKGSNGVVHVLSDSTLFSRAWLGNVMAEPSEPQRRTYEIAFDVFRALLGTIDRPISKEEQMVYPPAR